MDDFVSTRTFYERVAQLANCRTEELPRSLLAVIEVALLPFGTDEFSAVERRDEALAAIARRLQAELPEVRSEPAQL